MQRCFGAHETHKQLPKHLQEALHEGYLTQAQLRDLITFEAAMLDPRYDEAVQRAYNDTLPKNTVGADLRLLVSLLAASNAMPIYGRTLREAVGVFVDHLNALLAKTLTNTPVQSFITERSVDGVRNRPQDSRCDCPAAWRRYS